MTDLERSTFQGKPAYRYIRKTDKLPSTEEARELGLSAEVRVKLFDPTGVGTWWITGYDPETRIATGAAKLFEFEVGDIYMPELVDFRDGTFGLPIERDLYWDSATPLGAVVEEHQGYRHPDLIATATYNAIVDDEQVPAPEASDGWLGPRGEASI